MNRVTRTGAVFALMAIAFVLVVAISFSSQPSTRTLTLLETVTTSLPTTVTIVVESGNLENCTYTATSSFVTGVSEETNQGGMTTTIFEGGITTTTVSYVTTVNTELAVVGSVITTTTSPSAEIKYFYGTNEQVTALVQPPYIGEPYSVSCTFVK